MEIEENSDSESSETKKIRKYSTETRNTQETSNESDETIENSNRKSERTRHIPSYLYDYELNDNEVNMITALSAGNLPSGV